eukprot:6058423-Lingulodinium_polyedra.AAC.1
MGLVGSDKEPSRRRPGRRHDGRSRTEEPVIGPFGMPGEPGVFGPPDGILARVEPVDVDELEQSNTCALALRDCTRC